MPLRRARKTNLISARNHCPGISGIAVPYLLKSLSANYRNQCPGICETRKQEPVPAIGNIIKVAWLRFYDPAALAPTPRFVVQSWDTASKTSPQSDWSVCITVLIRGRDIYVLDVMRARLEFPDLHRRAGELAREYGANALLIEDQASGTQLIQTLRAEAGKGVPTPIARRPEGDKLSRVHGISSMIEAGRLHLPHEAPWLAGFLSELLAFPSGRHDDQVDALSQLLEWVRQRDSMQPGICAMPIIVSGPRQYGPC